MPHIIIILLLLLNIGIANAAETAIKAARVIDPEAEPTELLMIHSKLHYETI